MATLPVRAWWDPSWVPIPHLPLGTCPALGKMVCGQNLIFALLNLCFDKGLIQILE